MAELLVPKLESLLESIVSIGVLGKLNGISDQYLHQFFPVFLFESLGNENLNYAKSAIVGSQLEKLVKNLIKHKLPMFFFKLVYDTLDHMGALLVERKPYGLAFESVLEELDLRV